LRLNVIIFILFCVFNFFKLNAQTYNYSYSDPCTGNVKTVVVPINGNVTVGYYGEIGSFSYNDFTNGTFDAWTNNIFSQYGTNSPCSEIVGLGTAINVTQGTALNVIGILNSLSSISDLAGGSTNLIGGSVTTINNTGNRNSKGNGKKGNNSQNGSGNNTTTNTNNTTTNNTQNQTNGTGNSTQGGTTTSGSNEGGTNGGNGTNSPNAGTQNPTQAGGTTTQSGSNENGNTSPNTTVNGGTPNNPNQTTGGETSETPINNQTTTENGSNGGNTGNGSNSGSGSGESNAGNNQTQETQTTEEGGGQTNITGGATTTVKSTPSSKEGGKPTIVASGDFVGFNFRNSEVNSGLKVTGGYTAMRWDGKRSSGVLGDYTSALRGPNVTAFYAFIRPKSIVIGSGTLTIGFEGNRSLYGTIAVGQMFSFKKPKTLKLLYMGTVSYGNVYRESFLGTALIVGGTYDMRIGKRIDIKLMNLFVYAPYVSYYNDVVLKSPYVMLPSIGTNIKITKKFKFNINAGGAWDLKTSALNYTVTCGARMLVGQ
jgi:hypothetical protein